MTALTSKFIISLFSGVIMETLKVIQITPFYHPVIGGVEKVVENLAKTQVSKGHEVYVITVARDHYGNSVGPIYEERDDIRIHRLSSIFNYSFGSVMKGLGKLVQKLKPDIVHMHVYRHPHSLTGAIEAKRARAKVLLHGHSPFHDRRFIPRVQYAYYVLYDAFFPKILNDFYDGIIALYPGEAERYVKLGFSRRKVHVIPNGVDILFFEKHDPTDFLKAYHIAADRPIILYFARLNPEKGAHIFIKAIKNI